MRQLIVSVIFLSFALSASAQTYRGAINGTVADPSGSFIPKATVKATDVATGIERTTISTDDGEFAFQDVPVGTYRVVVTAPGFSPLTVENVLVSQGSIYTLPIRLKITQGATTVEVSAAALSLDTTTVTQTTLLTGKTLQTLPVNGRDFTQLIAATPGFGGYAAAGEGSLNGTRVTQVNWQIEGADNNDIWANYNAVNQPGVGDIAGTVLPMDSIEQFSVQTQSAPEQGRNPGGTVDLALKSGGNDFHGSVYDYVRNEAFAAASPFVISKKENRNQQYGFSFGGPILKNRLFFFTSYERQKFTIGLPGLGTEPSQAYQQEAGALLTAYHVPLNTVSTALLANLWPSYALTGAAAPENYSSPNPETGYSNNGLVKLDYKINDKNTLSFHWFAGQGNQIAPVGGSALSSGASELDYYYEQAPIHVQNYALAWNTIITPSLSNQVLAGTNYFRQLFNDLQNGFRVSEYGLLLSPDFDATGITGAPNIQIIGFDQTGLTPPEGREDITAHLTDALSYIVGKHQFRFGGEFRRAQLDEFYHRNSLGTFTFDGSQGPWYSDYEACTGYFAAISSCRPQGAGTYDYNILTLADFLAGNVSRSSIALGDPVRLVFVKTFSFFAQDAWQITPKFTFNYGLRWDYEGPLGNNEKDMSVFIPSKGGLVFQGNGISSIYPPDYHNFSPRIGFAYQPRENGSMVIRGGFGVFYDTPNLNMFLDNRPPNDAPNGIEGNPAGPKPVSTIAHNDYTIASGQPLFQPGVCPSGNGCGVDSFGNPIVYNIFSVAQDFQTPVNYNYNLNIQNSLGKNFLIQVGYLGSSFHHQMTTADINQPAISPTLANNLLNAVTPAQKAAAQAAIQASRPYFGRFPNFGVINQVETDGYGNYNSLQTVLKAREWHRFTTQVAYTWAHSLDIMSQFRGVIPQNSFYLPGDYGNGDYDTRHNFTAVLNYTFPLASHAKLLLNGWELTSLLSFHTGQPFTVYSATDTTGTNEGVQRANLIGDPFQGVSHAFNKSGVQWVNPAAFTDPPPGTLGDTARNALYGPGYGSVDLSVVKSTNITERIRTQFHVDMFNIFNRVNLAPPNGYLGGSFGLSADTIGDYNGAPGIGPGEAFNIQLALKIIF